jgi:hypothetical protein
VESDKRARRRRGKMRPVSMSWCSAARGPLSWD